MNISVDYYAHTNGLSQIEPGFKIALGLLTMIISLASPTPIIPLFVAFFMTFLILIIAEIPAAYYVRFAAFPIGFGVLTALMMALFFGTIPSTTILGLQVYSDGLHTGLVVLSHILGGFSCLSFIALTTPANEIFNGLERLRVPRVLIEVALLMYRSIFIFIEEASTMYHAQDTRLGYSGLRSSYRSLGLLTGNLFLRSWLRGENIHRSMESRCYHGTLPSFRRKKFLDIKGACLIALFEALLIAGIVLTAGVTIF